jgi:1-deoxy-D-xylulose-5-phosphate synthase
LLSHAAHARLIITLEDHVITGGFGSAVVEAVSDAGLGVAIERLGWPDTFVGHGSSQAILREAHGLSQACLLARVRRRLASLHKAIAPAVAGAATQAAQSQPVVA